MTHEGTWRTLPGQATDDGELALSLARSLDAEGRFDEQAVARAYAAWYLSSPFDMGRTTRMALAPAGEAVARHLTPTLVDRSTKQAL